MTAERVVEALKEAMREASTYRLLLPPGEIARMAQMTYSDVQKLVAWAEYVAKMEREVGP